MRRKVFLLIYLITNFVFAENGYYYVNLYEPYGKSPTYTEEITFYDDGLIKQIVHYNLKEACDFYNWEEIKKNLEIIKIYDIKRDDKKIEVILSENGSKKIVQVLNKIENNKWQVINQKQYNTSQFSINLDDKKYFISNEKIQVPNAEATLIDNQLIQLISCGKGFGGKEYREEFKVSYDGKNVYTIVTNHEYGEDSLTINFISDYIPFKKDAAILNQCITDYFILTEIFYTVPTISKQSIQNESFDLRNFYSKPFIYGKEIPGFFKSCKELIDYYEGYEIREREVINKYTKEKDKEYEIENTDMLLVYYCRSVDGVTFNEAVKIKELENLKYDFNQNMTQADIIAICGNRYLISENKTNFDYHYNSEEGFTIHFLIDKKSKNLFSIVITSER